MRAAFGALTTFIGFIAIAILVACIMPYAIYTVCRDVYKEWRVGKKPRIWGFN